MWVVGVYLLGSVSVGDIVPRILGVDIRGVGTGNPGAANVYREVGPAYGLAVFVLDVIKGGISTVPLFLLGFPFWFIMTVALMMLAGHIFPIPWKSVGGTGLAVGMGTTLGLLPLGVFTAALPSIVAVIITRNAGFAGGLFFVVTVISGAFFHRELMGVVAVAFVGIVVLIKSTLQYREK